MCEEGSGDEERGGLRRGAEKGEGRRGRGGLEEGSVALRGSILRLRRLLGAGRQCVSVLSTRINMRMVTDCTAGRGADASVNRCVVLHEGR